MTDVFTVFSKIFRKNLNLKYQNNLLTFLSIPIHFHHPKKTKQNKALTMTIKLLSMKQNSAMTHLCSSWKVSKVTYLSQPTNLFTNLIPVVPGMEKAMAPHSSTLAWKIPWTEEPRGLQSMGSLRAGHDWGTSLSLSTFMHWRRKWQPTPVFLPGESRDRGAW